MTCLGRLRREHAHRCAVTKEKSVTEASGALFANGEIRAVIRVIRD
jgi:hypothetical protein